jgi:hypothetical protein
MRIESQAPLSSAFSVSHGPQGECIIRDGTRKVILSRAEWHRVLQCGASSGELFEALPEYTPRVWARKRKTFGVKI